MLCEAKYWVYGVTWFLLSLTLVPCAEAQSYNLKYLNFGTFPTTGRGGNASSSFSMGPNIRGTFTFSQSGYENGIDLYDETVGQFHAQVGPFGSWSNDSYLNGLGGPNGISGFFQVPSDNNVLGQGNETMNWNFNRSVLPNTKIGIWDPGSADGGNDGSATYSFEGTTLNGKPIDFSLWAFQLLNPYGDSWQRNRNFQWDPIHGTLTVTYRANGVIIPSRVFMIDIGNQIFDHLQLHILSPNTDNLGISIQMPQAVPEANTMILFGLGSLGLLWISRRR
jgi:hypothetical protein